MGCNSAKTEVVPTLEEQPAKEVSLSPQNVAPDGLPIPLEDTMQDHVPISPTEAVKDSDNRAFTANIFLNSIYVGFLTLKGIQLVKDHLPIPSITGLDTDSPVVIRKTSRRILTVGRFHLRLPKTYCERIDIIWTGNRIELTVDEKVIFGEERTEHQFAPRAQQIYDAKGHMRYELWRAQATEVLNDVKHMITTIEDFPEPPLPLDKPCEDVDCVNKRSLKKLTACKHTVERVFRDAELKKQYTYKEVVKFERLRWHPDKFSSCNDDVRKEIQAKATELFTIISALPR